jgi:capsular exopolysaccharide synthesis family protein
MVQASSSPNGTATSGTAGQSYDKPAPSQPQILRAIRRRQSLFLLVSLASFAVMGVNLARERIFSPSYTGGFQILLNDPIGDGSKGRGGASGSTELAELANLTTNARIPDLVQVLRSPSMLEPLAAKMRVSAAKIDSNLRIAPPSEDVQDVLLISLNWSDPAQGVSILRALADEYLDFSKRQRLNRLQDGITFLDTQAPVLEKKVNDIQSELEAFRRTHNLITPDARGSALQSRYDVLKDELGSLRRQQAELTSQARSIQSGTLSPAWLPSTPLRSGPADGAAPANPAAPTTTGLMTPQQQLDQLDQKIAEASASYRPDSPVLRSLLAERNQLRPVVQQQAMAGVVNQLNSNLAQQAEIVRQLQVLRNNFQRSPALIKTYEGMQQRLEVAKLNYSGYIQARENFRLEASQQSVPWKLIASPRFNEVPTKPNVSRGLLQSAALALIIGAGAALLRDRLDNMIHTPQEVEEQLNLPVLGLIPYLPLQPGLTVMRSIEQMDAGDRFAVRESLRSLFTTFRLLRSDRAIRLVAVTSSGQGEGKSTATSIFATTLANLGLKVLIIDADMRLPRQHRYLGLENNDGFSNLLTDSSLDIRSLIRPISDTLHLITAGPKPPDPAKLLSSRRCGELLNDMRSGLDEYEIILFDTPPALLLADPVLLGEKVDGLLYLVGLGRIDRTVAPQALRRVQASGVDVLGAIANQIEFPTSLNDYGYGYGYGYRYGYGGYSDRYRNNYKTAAVMEERAGTLKPQAQGTAVDTAAQRVSQFLRERKGR